ncbi:hypothetical protein BDV93DRAFT_564592 [Ceratobasidium sp. AG-I]|nr:hypothetical protein BDV93DRAFT_564592 [Ceratobasidium sp. AG-I]
MDGGGTTILICNSSGTAINLPFAANLQGGAKGRRLLFGKVSGGRQETGMGTTVGWSSLDVGYLGSWIAECVRGEDQHDEMDAEIAVLWDVQTLAHGESKRASDEVRRTIDEAEPIEGDLER